MSQQFAVGDRVSLTSPSSGDLVSVGAQGEVRWVDAATILVKWDALVGRWTESFWVAPSRLCNLSGGPW